MTDDATAQDKASSKRTKSEARRAFSLGRRIALAIYWAFALYMAGVGFWSIPKQIFFPRHGESAYATCNEGLRALLTELESEEIPSGESRGEAGARDRRRTFLHAWDEQFTALRTVCSNQDDAYHDLERLRYRVESALVRYEREQAPLVQSIERELPERSSR